MKNFKTNIKGITLVSLAITVVILLILAGISIGKLFGENGLLNKANKSADEYNKRSDEEQQQLAELGEYFGNSDGDEKPTLPEVDTTSKIKFLGEYSQVADELTRNNYVKVASCIVLDGTPKFNDEIFTVYNYNIGELNIDQWGSSTPNWYMADETRNTRNAAIEFNISCKEFRVAGVGGFRLSVWDYDKNKWQYVVSKTGINEESDSIYSVEFPDEKQRTVRIETLDVFYRIVCKRG